MTIPVADGHCDYLYYMLHRDYSMENPVRTQAVSLPAMEAGGAALQLFAAWIDPDERTSALQQCLCMIDGYHRLLKNTPAFVPFSPEFEPGCGKIAALLTIEGGEAIEGRLENLRMFYALGVRAMSLTWNASNELASPAMSRRDKGLTTLGRTVVREMERLNMAVDVAHLSDAGIDGVLDATCAPIFSSHTNARSVCRHRRSLSDRHIKEIASRGGVVCVNYFSPQLVQNGRATVSDVARHVAHIARVAGPEHVALGSDFDGMGQEAYPEGLSSWRGVPLLLEALTRVGFHEKEVRAIAYDNLAGYFKRFV